jgi:DNA-binding phage protein
MPKVGCSDAQKYQDNPKMIAKYLNVALATDDAAVIVKAIGDRLRVQGMSRVSKKSGCVAKASTDHLQEISARVAIRL